MRARLVRQPGAAAYRQRRVEHHRRRLHGDRAGQPHRSTPAGRGAYVIRQDASNLASVLDDLLARGPRAENRRDLRTDYLGEFPADRYAEGFLAEARRCVAV